MTTTDTNIDFTEQALVVTKALLDDLSATALPEDVEDALVDARLAVNLALNGATVERAVEPEPEDEAKVERTSYKIELKLSDDGERVESLVVNGETMEQNMSLDEMIALLEDEEEVVDLSDHDGCAYCDPENYFAIERLEGGRYHITFPDNPITGGSYGAECEDDVEVAMALGIAKSLFGYASHIAACLQEEGLTHESIMDIVFDPLFNSRIELAVNEPGFEII